MRAQAGSGYIRSLGRSPRLEDGAPSCFHSNVRNGFSPLGDKHSERKPSGWKGASHKADLTLGLV